MSQPVGYYVSSDSELLEQMQESWGTQFQKLTNVERIWMISKLAENLCAELDPDDEQEIRGGVESAMERLDELSMGQQAGLILALINQIKGI